MFLHMAYIYASGAGSLAVDANNDRIVHLASFFSSVETIFATVDAFVPYRCT